MTKVTCPVKPIEPVRPTFASIKKKEETICCVINEGLYTKEELLK